MEASWLQSLFTHHIKISEASALPTYMYTTEESYGLHALYAHHINTKETCGVPHIIIKTDEGGLRPPVQSGHVTGGLRPTELDI